jgi:manganese-dependent ADP-ribose/CDP-alcohol diphosphatase
MVTEMITRRQAARMLASGALVAVATDRGTARETMQENSGFAFGVIADAQYCDAEPAGTRYYRASPKKLAKCVESLNQMDLAFVIHLGDFIDRGIGSYNGMTSIYNRLEAPHYHVLGNHDFAVEEANLDDVPRMLGLRERYYCFRTNGWRFVVLDGNDLSLFARRKGSREHDKAQSLYAELKNRHAINAQTWNGAVGEAQRTWLDQQLTEADKSNERVVVFCHYPVDPENPHNLWNDREIVRVLGSHRSVVAFMNGHNHAGNYAEKDGIHYVTFPGMVETASTTAYAVVHVNADDLRVTGYGRTPSRRLKIRK